MPKSFLTLLTSLLLLTAWSPWCGGARAAEEEPQIHTVLPMDAIPAILDPAFVPATQAKVEDMAAMIGVVFDQEAHAYSSVVLNYHEIVNDVVAGVKIATTW